MNRESTANSTLMQNMHRHPSNINKQSNNTQSKLSCNLGFNLNSQSAAAMQTMVVKRPVTAKHQTAGTFKTIPSGLQPGHARNESNLHQKTTFSGGTRMGTPSGSTNATLRSTGLQTGKHSNVPSGGGFGLVQMTMASRQLI